MKGRGARARKGKGGKKGERKGGKGRGARLFPMRWVVLALAASIVFGLVGFLAGRGVVRAPGSEPYRDIIERWCARHNYNVNPDLAAAVLETESSGRERAVSSAGALGLMQLMPATAEAMAKELGLAEPSREDLFDPELNIRLGVYYLSKLRKRFGEERPFVIAAYHAGPTRVDRWRRRRTDLPAAKVIEELAYPSTRTYLRRVLRRWRKLGGAKTQGRSLLPGRWNSRAASAPSGTKLSGT